MSELADLLRAHPFVQGLAPGLLDRMSECIEGTVEWKPDQVIFREGGTADSCFLVLSGDVALEVHSPGRPPRIIQTVGSGEVLGWSFLFEPYRWAFDARALNASSALVLDGVKMRNCAADEPEYGLQLMTRFAGLVIERLQATRLQLMDLYANRT